MKRHTFSSFFYLCVCCVRNCVLSFCTKCVFTRICCNTLRDDDSENKKNEKGMMFLLRSSKNAGREMLCMMRFRCRAMSTSSESMPPHPAEFLLNQPLKLYRDCLRLADYLAHKQSVPRFALREQVRHVWRKNQYLIDAEEIQKAREAALRGLSNSMMHFATENLDNPKGNQRSAFLEDEEEEEEEEEEKK